MSSDKEIDENNECVEIKNCTKNGMYNTKADCEKAISGEGHKICEPSGECYNWTIYCNEALGEYKTEAACKKANKNRECKKTSDERCWFKGSRRCMGENLFSTSQECLAASEASEDDDTCRETEDYCYELVSTCKYTSEIKENDDCDSCIRGGKTYYFCDCFNENNKDNPCYGLNHCDGVRDPEILPECTCGNTQYYKACWVWYDPYEACQEAAKSAYSKIFYYKNNHAQARNRIEPYYCAPKYYKSQDICTYNNTDYMYCTVCDDFGVDISGNETPRQQGFKYCGETEDGVGEESKVCPGMYKECTPNEEKEECLRAVNNLKSVIYYDDDSVNNAENKIDRITCDKEYYKSKDICTYNNIEYMYCTKCKGPGKDINGELTPGAQGFKYCEVTEDGVGEESKVCPGMYKECIINEERAERERLNKECEELIENDPNRQPDDLLKYTACPEGYYESKILCYIDYLKYRYCTPCATLGYIQCEDTEDGLDESDLCPGLFKKCIPNIEK